MELSSTEYAEIKRVFYLALSKSETERAALLDAEVPDLNIRQEIEKLLIAAEDDRSGLERSAFERFSPNIMPEMIGDHRVIREIGSGGMGIVYEVERRTQTFTQRAAAKVIRRGMNNEMIVRRFLSEQQILASLDHSNIAGLLDSGETSGGLPFYVMEYVEGIPIDTYCRDNDLSLESKISLFRQVCSAVSYAHSQLIVHRDLKPSNILVTNDGAIKLLDFGIAKMIDVATDLPGTATQLGMMTPQYASPEQIRGEKVTTLSDVYSLGVILYELVAGVKPYVTDGLNLGEIFEVVNVHEPQRPSYAATIQVGADLRGDIDVIVLKALDKDPNRRYSSAEQLSDDLRRFTVGLPISSRPDTISYRMKKFVSRNRIGVAAAAIVALTMVIGIAATAVQYFNAERQRVLAEKRFAEVRDLANNVVFKYHDEIAKLNGSTAIREMLVADATVYLDNLSKDAGDDVELTLELALAYRKLGDVQGKLYSANIGNTSEALKSYRRSVLLLENAASKNPDNVQLLDELIASYDSLVTLMARSNTSADEKRSLMDRSVEIYEKALKLGPEDTLRTVQLASIFIRYGDTVGSPTNRDSLEEKYREHLKALPLAEKAFVSSPQDQDVIRLYARANQRIGTDLVWIGDTFSESGDETAAKDLYARALPYHQRMLEVLEKHTAKPGNDPESKRYLSGARTSYSESLARNSQFEQAFHYAMANFEAAKESLLLDTSNSEAKFNLATANETIANVFKLSGDLKRSAEYRRTALEICEEIIKKDKNNFEAFSRLIEQCEMLLEIYEMNGEKSLAGSMREKLVQINSLKQKAQAESPQT